METPVSIAVSGSRREQRRACYPDRQGLVERDGVRVHWEGYGSGEPVVMLLPTWSIVHSRCWKMQIPISPGTTKSDLRPAGNGAFGPSRRPAGLFRGRVRRDALAVMDAAGATGRWSSGLAGRAEGADPGRGSPRPGQGLVLVGPFLGPAMRQHGPERRGGPAALTSGPRDRRRVGQLQRALLAPRLDRVPGVLLRPGVQRAAFHQADRGLRRLGAARPTRDAHHRPCDPASATRAHARAVRTGELSGPGHSRGGRRGSSRTPSARSAAAAITGGALVSLEGSGHCPQARDPVPRQPCCAISLGTPPPQLRRWARATRARSGRSTSPRRSASATCGGISRSPTSCASFIPTSRSTGWRKTRSPRCSSAEASGSIPPASSWPASPATCRRSQQGHDLHVFQALRRMDEILAANFMVFLDAVRQEQYDLWIGDEAWDRRLLPAREP